MNEAQNPQVGELSNPTFDYPVSAFAISISMPFLPSWYRRTYALAIALGPLICGIAGLFDRDCEVWVYSKTKGFRPVVLTRRAK